MVPCKLKVTRSEGQGVEEDCPGGKEDLGGKRILGALERGREGGKDDGREAGRGGKEGAGKGWKEGEGEGLKWRKL